MDYSFLTTPASFQSDLAAATMPPTVRDAIAAAWAATIQTDPTYRVFAATGDLWTVIRIAAEREA